MPLYLFKAICTDHKIDTTDIKAAKAALLELFSVSRESELWERQLITKYADDECHIVLDKYYKAIAKFTPHPLNNKQIDVVLDQLELLYPDFFNFHISMLNFEEYDGALHQFLTVADKCVTGKGLPYTFQLHETREQKEILKKKSRFACVVNSDRLGGIGKHWTCIFIDLTGRPTVEFFNSSGNAPYREIVSWQIKCCKRLGEVLGEPVEFIPVTNIRHQRGDTECGVYCLYYIWDRLQGMSYKKYKHDEVPDDVVTVFRKTIYREAD